MQPKGSLTETDLRSLLESAQSERATGTLTVREGDRACMLYFLFGHLFHAMSDGVSGDDAVLTALNWPEGNFDFDAKAKLPPDETVKSTIPELLQNAGTPAGSPDRQEGRAEPEAAPAPIEEPAAPQSDPVGWHTVEPEPDMTPSIHTQEATPAPEPPPATNHEPSSWDEIDAPQPRRSTKQRTNTRHGREPVPVPAGSVMYDALKTSFVDFPRLITTLEKEGYTGYVRLLTDDASGLIFFRDGSALECIYDSGGEMLMGRQALSAFNQQVGQGQGALDVVNLSPELVNGVHQMTVGQPMYSELYASWVDMPALLGFLQQRQLTGSVAVRSKSATGVIILTSGDLTGAYTTESRDVARDVNGVLSLCSDPEAVIEVKSADGEAPVKLDVDEVVGRRSTRQPAAPPPPPTPTAPQQTAAPVTSNPHNPGPDTQSLRYSEQSVGPQANATPRAQFGPSSPADTRFEAQGSTAAATTVRTGAPDWEQMVSDLQTMADESLGNRSRKVKDVLGAADRSQEGVMEAINQVPTISILFIDHSRLESLADEMRARVQSYIS